ncbi:hypothetical protein [Streptomyces sp. GbtcB6]|nr:hypothetical protein [Streptomyces sp. GbtcB6]
MGKDGGVSTSQAPRALPLAAAVLTGLALIVVRLSPSDQES